MRKVRLLVYILIYLMIMTMSSCGKNGHKLDLKNSGGIYMEYTIPKDDFTYEDDYKDALKRMAGSIQNRLSVLGTVEVYVANDKICIEILKEQAAEKCREIIEHDPTLYFIYQYGTNGDANFENNNGTWELTKDIEELIIDGSAGLSNGDILQAETRTGQDEVTKENEYVVSISMTEEGTNKFQEMTQKAFDDNARIAIWYEGRILCAPIVQTVLTNGQASIAGLNSYEEAENLARSIRMGPLPYEIQQISYEVYERKKLEK